MSDDLEERLKSHAQSFDGLLSLIPSKLYYGAGDTSDQWSKKKQTKEEAVLAKKRKLDPDGEGAKTAKDGRIELDNEDGSDDGEDGEEKVVVLSKKQLKKLKKEMKGDIATGPPPAKKQKKAEPPKTEETADDAEKKTSAAQTPKKEKAKKEEKKPATPKATDKPKENGIETPAKATPKSKQEKKKEQQKKATPTTSKNDDATDSDVEMEDDKPAEPVATKPVTDVVVPDADSQETEQPSTEETAKPTGPAKPTPSAAELKARLQAKIEAFRAKRKANDPNAPALTRSELLASRKEKDEARRKRKLEMRAAAKLAEQEGQKGSPVGDSKEIISAVAKEEIERASRQSSVGSARDGNYTFSSVVFDDGAAVTRTPGQSSTPFAPGTVNKKRKGPSDAYTALQKIAAKKSRIENMPEEKKAAIEEKETWAKAVKHAAGEKVRDDEKLLKKTLKRQEKQKKKSSKEWGDRKEGVQKSQEIRIKKREENIAQRIEMKKAGKGSKKQKAAAAKKKVGTKFKGKSRPGFEGGSGKVKPGSKSGGKK